jgi:glycosyltransferase involved in cell wall biosynthesis
MSKILFVVHRYVPYAGGSEYYVRDMAEECLKRHHDVTVLAHENQGDQNGVKVTDNYNALMDKWDLIIVHGADVSSQTITHVNAFSIKSPVVYMLIKPSESAEALNGMKHHRFISYSTSMDIEHLRNHQYLYKGRRIRHGVVPEQTIAQPNVYAQPTYVSAGGFYPHKGMLALAEAFENSNIKGQLHLYGYIDGPMPKQTDKVKVFLGQSKYNVMCAIAGAEGYIMNSYEEGFGLVLLEAMMNKTPWYARNIAGAADMKKYGHVYENERQLIELLSKPLDTKTEDAYNYVMANHTIHDTVNDIEDILMEIL